VNVALLEELLGLLKTVNETIGVPQGQSIEDKNVLQGNNPSDPNKRVTPTLNSNERKRTTEIASLFAKTFFEYQKKKTPDKAIKTSIQKITPRQSSRAIPPPPSNKPGSILAGILAMLGGAGALLLGLLTDGPFKGILKILSKLSIQGGIKMLMAGAKAFIGTLSEFVTAPFKVVRKLFGKGIMGKMLSFMKPLLKVLRRIPLIGSIISIGFAISRFSGGDTIGGVIDVLSALSGLLNLIPGGSIVAVPLSLGLDILNAWLDIKTAGAKDKQGAKMDLLGDMAKSLGNWIWKNALWIPVIGGFKRMQMSWDAFKGGDIKGGLYQFGAALLSFGGLGPIVTGIEMLMGFGEKKESDKSLSPKTGWFDGLKAWIKKKLKDLPYVLRKPLEWFGILEDDGSGELDAGFSKSMGDGYGKLKEFSGKTWESASQSFSKGFEWFKGKASTLWNSLPEAIGKSANWIADKFNGLTESFGKFFTSLSQQFEPAIDKIGKFLNEFVGKVVGWVKGLISFGGGEETPGLSEAQKSQKAKEAGYSSWEEYKKANWKWKGSTPEPTNPQSLMINSGNQQSLEFLRNIGMTQIKIMGDIKVIAAQILKKMDGGMGGGNNTNISIPSQSQPAPQSSQISLNSNRGDYGSSAYALA
jgi:hypothetical protein